MTPFQEWGLCVVLVLVTVALWRAALRIRELKLAAVDFDRRLRRLTVDDDLACEIKSMTGEFGDWDDADAELIEGQAAEVAADHNRMLARLNAIRSLATRVLDKRRGGTS